MSESLSSELRHALRTPLNQILGYCDLLMEDAKDRSVPDFLPDLERIRTAGNDLMRIIDAARLGTPIDAEPTTAREVESDPGLDYLDEFLPPEPREEGRLLVVDDQPANRDVLVRMLEKRGYSLMQAENGTDALRQLTECAEGGDPFELVLLDIVMPETNGWEVLQRLKADERLKDTPVIMISGVDDTDAVVRCLELGADDFVQKPFVPAILKARVSVSLEHKRARDREAALFQRLQDSYRELREYMAQEANL